jgi:hypothetical protein
MESNVIYKIFLKDSALNQASQNNEAPIKNIFEKINPFQLFNILGKNNLFIFGIVLLILYSWFIRANISLGAIFGFLFLGFIFYLYYQYQFYAIKDYTVDKQEKQSFISNILSKNNDFPIEGTFFLSQDFFELDNDITRNYIYFNPAVIDFYYSNKELIKYSYRNFAMSLRYMNNMILLHQYILGGLVNRGNQLTEIEFLRKKCLNSWQAVIYNLPSSNAMNEKHKNSMNLLAELTQKIINDCYKKVEQQNAQEGINMSYYPIVRNGPEANDVGTFGYNNHYDFF